MCLSRPCHPVLLYPLLLLSLLAASPARAQNRQHDTLLLHFAFNSYTLAPDHDTAQWRQFFNQPGITIDTVFITGYTDTVGGAAYNQHLSTLRAVAAANRMDSQLLNTSLHPAPSKLPVLFMTGGGEAPTPQYSDSANRRAEIIFSYTTTAPPTQASAPSPADSSVPREPTIVISLQHINFVVDTPIPTDVTQTVLPGYVKLLQQYKDRHMEIDGYVNSFVPLHGESDPLFILSLKRAKFIYDYLVDAGFDPAKLTYKGMGNATPINPEPATRDEMNANMRVEIKVY
jgi:outer membrane protein OmpA-like peptidoglycan-associated protein